MTQEALMINGEPMSAEKKGRHLRGVKAGYSSIDIFNMTLSMASGFPLQVNPLLHQFWFSVECDKH